MRLLPKCGRANIVPTQDPENLAPCTVVVDTGGKYDPQRHRCDRHQRSFTETMSLSPGEPWPVELSGLGYPHRHKLRAQLLGTSEEDSMVGTSVTR